MGSTTMEKLKAERVQEAARGCLHPPEPAAPAGPSRPKVERLKAERVQSQLKRLPRWRLTADKRAITRTFRFKTAGSQLAFAEMVVSLAQESGRSSQLTLYKNEVALKLTTPTVRGLTLEDFTLARRISLLA